MKLLFLLICCSLSSMDQSEIEQRTKQRATRYAQFVTITRMLEHEERESRSPRKRRKTSKGHVPMIPYENTWREPLPVGKPFPPLIVEQPIIDSPAVAILDLPTPEPTPIHSIPISVELPESKTPKPESLFIIEIEQEDPEEFVILDMADFNK